MSNKKIKIHIKGNIKVFIINGKITFKLEMLPSSDVRMAVTSAGAADDPRIG